MYVYISWCCSFFPIAFLLSKVLDWIRQISLLRIVTLFTKIFVQILIILDVYATSTSSKVSFIHDLKDCYHLIIHQFWFYNIYNKRVVNIHNVDNNVGSHDSNKSKNLKEEVIFFRQLPQAAAFLILEIIWLTLWSRKKLPRFY